MLFQILHVFSHFVALPSSVMVVRLKNGQTLKDDYRIKQRSDALIIRGVTEMDAGNYTIVLTNKITKEEQRRSFQLLVNSKYSLFFPCVILLELPDAVIQETVVIKRHVFFHSSSSHYRERGGCGH